MGLPSLVLENNYFDLAMGSKGRNWARPLARSSLCANHFMIRLVEASADKPLNWMRSIAESFVICMLGEGKWKFVINH